MIPIDDSMGMRLDRIERSLDEIEMLLSRIRSDIKLLKWGTAATIVGIMALFLRPPLG